MRRTILFGILVFAIVCSGDATAPPNSVDPGPPQFEVVGEYLLRAVGDTVITSAAVSTVNSEDCVHPRWSSANRTCAFSFYLDEYSGYYTLFVGPGGELSLYADSTYLLAYREIMVTNIGGMTIIGRGTVFLEGRWTATGTMYDTLSFTDDMYRLDILRGAEPVSRTTAVEITMAPSIWADLVPGSSMACAASR